MSVSSYILTLYFVRFFYLPGFLYLTWLLYLPGFVMIIRSNELYYLHANQYLIISFYALYRQQENKKQ